MGTTFGRNVYGSTGFALSVLADYSDVEWKAGGVTIDWDTVDAVADDPVTFNDGSTVPVGAKALRYGQILCKITTSGMFGPHDPDASDGRETLARGDCFILDQTVFEQNPLGGLTPLPSNHPAVFDGGTVWKARVLMTTDTHSLADGPTVDEFETAFPDIHYVTT